LIVQHFLTISKEIALPPLDVVLPTLPFPE